MYSVFKVACLYDSSCNDAAIIFYWQPPVSIENMIERCGEHVRVCMWSCAAKGLYRDPL